MEEIEVGEYIRTKSGSIIKIDSLRDIGYLEETSINFKNTIIKHSKNIIDLIEEGDYVNGKLVTDIQCMQPKMNGNHIYIIKCGNIGFEVNKIKSIVTKEQFEQMKYIVKED